MNIRNAWALLPLLLLLTGCGNSQQKNQTAETSSEDTAQQAPPPKVPFEVDQALTFAQKQYRLMLDSLEPTGKSPRSVKPDGTYRMASPHDWTSGFFPGSLWLLYKASQNDNWRKQAQTWMEPLDSIQYHTRDHDIGFMMYCPFGNALRFTEDQDEYYQKTLVQSAKSLMTRFDPQIGCTKSWGNWFSDWQYPVIVDNMMNLELLFWATRQTGDSSFYEAAFSHAKTTLKNHYRPDGSCYHVVDYDSTTGQPRWKGTRQGFADESTWARGQSWGLYGFTMAFRETKHKPFLNQAQTIAEFLMNHPNLPPDRVPYWDYNAPNIPDAPRDASAAAIMASALYELANYSPEKGASYRQFADSILESLSSEAYRARLGENHFFLIKHSVGSKPDDSEVDTPINYADYYFLEALLRKQSPTGLIQ